MTRGDATGTCQAFQATAPAEKWGTEPEAGTAPTNLRSVPGAERTVLVPDPDLSSELCAEATVPPSLAGTVRRPDASTAAN